MFSDVDGVLKIPNVGTNDKSFLMQTQKGMIGSVNSEVVPGDRVIVPLGGHVPIVLRPHGKKYFFVGECYCHGFIDGEALIEARKQADPMYDGKDRSWLNRLHESAPFPVEEFIII